MKDVKELAGDIDPLQTGVTSLATSMMTGDIAGKIGGKFKDAFTIPKVQGLTKDILESGAWDESGDFLKNIVSGGGDIKASGLKGLFKDFDIMDMLVNVGGKKGFDNLQILPILLNMFKG